MVITSDKYRYFHPDIVTVYNRAKDAKRCTERCDIACYVHWFLVHTDHFANIKWSSFTYYSESFTTFNAHMLIIEIEVYTCIVHCGDSVHAA